MKINDKEYEFRWGFSAYRWLQHKWNLKGFDEVIERIQTMEHLDMDILFDIVKSGLVRYELTDDVIVDWLDSLGPNINDISKNILKEAMDQFSDGSESKKKT
jgi:hypothetical protein